MPKTRDRWVRQLHNGSNIFHGYPILWDEALDMGIFTRQTNIQFVKMQTVHEPHPLLPVVMHMTMFDELGFVDAPIGHVINQRYTSVGFEVQFKLNSLAITEDLRQLVYDYLVEKDVLMTVSAFVNGQVGREQNMIFTHFPVAAIYLYSTDQVEDTEDGKIKET